VLLAGMPRLGQPLTSEIFKRSLFQKKKRWFELLTWIQVPEYKHIVE